MPVVWQHVDWARQRRDSPTVVKDGTWRRLGASRSRNCLMPDVSPVEKQEETQRRDRATQFSGFVRSELQCAGDCFQAGTQSRQPKSARCPDAIALSKQQQQHR
ncbi:hypothetical protein GRJ2_001927800 [Grus japonensis]|uniref:Uncharacterized protein n=1 Tax=Grus japonensis TaxID=30415 RepID=A0ABC9XBX6_GRUJA